MKQEVAQYRGLAQLTPEGEDVKLIIKDPIDGRVIIEILINKYNVAHGLMTQDVFVCHYRPLGTDTIGKVVEEKVQEIHVSARPWDERQQTMDEAVEPYEVDGWIAYQNDMLTPLRFVRYENNGSVYNVRFRRYVRDLS